jgi:hypothetical protein
MQLLDATEKKFPARIIFNFYQPKSTGATLWLYKRKSLGNKLGFAEKVKSNMVI